MSCLCLCLCHACPPQVLDEYGLLRSRNRSYISRSGRVSGRLPARRLCVK